MIHQSKMKWSEVVARNIMPTRVVSVAFKPVKKSRVKTTIVNERNVDGTIHINSSDESRFKRKGDGKKLYTYRERNSTNPNKKRVSKPVTKNIEKRNKITNLEEYIEMRERFFDPIYEGDLTDIQGFEIVPHYWVDYDGPGKVIDDQFFPPPRWIYPGVDYEKIWCHIDAIENGFFRKYRILYDSDLKPYGVRFFTPNETEEVIEKEMENDHASSQTFINVPTSSSL